MPDPSVYNEPTFEVLVAIFQIEELVARIRHRVRNQAAVVETGGADWVEGATLIQTRATLEELAGLLGA